MTRLTVTQEEILATMRANGKPIRHEEIVADIRHRYREDAIHRSTELSINKIWHEFQGLAELGRVRRIEKDSPFWELVPRVEFIEDNQ